MWREARRGAARHGGAPRGSFKLTQPTGPTCAAVHGRPRDSRDRFHTKPDDPGGTKESDGIAVKADASISEDMGDVARAEVPLLSSAERLFVAVVVALLRETRTPLTTVKSVETVSSGRPVVLPTSTPLIFWPNFWVSFRR